MFGFGWAYRPMIEIIAIPMTIPAAVHTNLGILKDHRGMRTRAAMVHRVVGQMHTQMKPPYATASSASMVVRRPVVSCGNESGFEGLKVWHVDRMLWKTVSKGRWCQFRSRSVIKVIILAVWRSCDRFELISIAMSFASLLMAGRLLKAPSQWKADSA
jgi:hypothetical protein